MGGPDCIPRLRIEFPHPFPHCMIALRLERDIEKEEMAESRPNLRYYLRQQPVMLAIAMVLVVIAFVAVTALSHAYHAQREALGDRWFNRGVADLNAKNF